MPLALSCHPDCLTDAVRSVGVYVGRQLSGRITVRYEVHGELDRLVLPRPAQQVRADDLWQKTCFEAFLAVPGKPAYLELNLSPSSEWALYVFETYRGAMRNFEPARPPRIETLTEAGKFVLVADVELGDHWATCAGDLEIALAAVIEEKTGAKSLWALSHPSGSPDFHNRDGFIFKLGATDSR